MREGHQAAGERLRVKPKSVTLDDERTYPETPDTATFQHHLARYEFLLPEVGKDDEILETGCGTGYGSHMLSQRARLVVAVDYSEAALEYAQERYSAPNLKYVMMNCHRLGLASGSFDWVVSFEMFEHLEEPEVYLSECRRVLREGGRLVLSTPNRAPWEIHMRSVRMTNEYHINMVDLKELRALLGRCFSNVEIYSQWRRGNTLHRTLRALDVWNLRLRLVRPERREILQQAMGVPGGSQAKSRDWVFTQSQRRQANHFVAICRK